MRLVKLDKIQKPMFYESINRKVYFCHYCKCELTKDTCTRDHIVPLSLGGVNIVENLVVSCGGCNSRKGSHVTVFVLTTAIRLYNKGLIGKDVLERVKLKAQGL